MPAGEELVGLAVRVPADLRRRLRIAAASEDKEIQQIVTEALDAHLRSLGY